MKKGDQDRFCRRRPPHADLWVSFRVTIRPERWIARLHTRAWCLQDPAAFLIPDPETTANMSCAS